MPTATLSQDNDGTYDIVYPDGTTYKKSIEEIQDNIAFLNSLKSDPNVTEHRKQEADLVISELSEQLEACRNA